MNQFPTPLPGQPVPDVLCGFCGAVSQPRRGARSSPESRLVEQMMLDSRGGRRAQLASGGGGPGGMGSGPMVRINVGGQRRLVPLALLLALMAEEADKSNAAQAGDVAALPTQKMDASTNVGEQTKCMICLDEFVDGDDLKTLPCLHIYHQKCIERWLGTDNSCPICKTPISGHAGLS